MHSDFSTLARSAKGTIPVPDIPMEALRSHARRGAARERLRTFVAGTAICLVALGVGAGFGRTIYDGVSVWWSGGNESIILRSLATTMFPTIADLRGVLARATFPVVLPVGVPPGTRLTYLSYSPLDHPNMLLLQYQNERMHFDAPIALYGPAADAAKGALPLENGIRPFSQAVYRWQIGSETVTIPKAHISQADAGRIKTAMMKASPRASLIATARMLPTIVVLGSAPKIIALAERYAPAKGRSVLVGQSEVHRLGKLAKSGKPMLDMRTLRWINMPLLRNGSPDFAHATQRPLKIIAVPANGVKALRAALLFAGACRCELLYNQPNAATYWVWAIPENASAETVRKYAISTKTLAVHLVR